MSGISINQGTQTNIAADTVGTTNYQLIKLDVGVAGASSLFTGTLKETTTLVGGTITALAKGTISAGTFAMTTGTLAAGTILAGTITNLVSGTVDTIGLMNANAFGTTVTSGTSTLGTIKGSVAGSSIYITDIVVAAGAATNVVIGNGGTSIPVLGTLFFNPNSGIVSNFRTPIQLTTGSSLVYRQSENGA